MDRRTPLAALAIHWSSSARLASIHISRELGKEESQNELSAKQQKAYGPIATLSGLLSLLAGCRTLHNEGCGFRSQITRTATTTPICDPPSLVPLFGFLEQLFSLRKSSILSLFYRRSKLVDSGLRFRIGSVSEQKLDHPQIVFGGRVVQRTVVVNSSLFDMSTKREEKFEDFVPLRTVCG